MKEYSFLYRTPTRLYETGGSCARCFLASDERESGIVATGGRFGSSTNPEKRFAGLFEAARALLHGRISDEDQIFPTLKLASKTGERVTRLLYRGVDMVKIVGDVPILRRKPVQAHGVSSARSARQAISAVIIVATASGRAISANDIAEAYEQVLREEGMPWGGAGGRVTYLFAGDMLQVEIEEFDELVARGDERRWPTPATVGRCAEAALEEFGEDLVLRKRGGSMNPENLILAMVAHLLGNALPKKGGKTNRVEVQRLLNAHVLCSAPWKRLQSGSNTSQVVQLWTNVKKVSRMEELFEPGPMYVSAPTLASHGDGDRPAP